MSAPNDIILYNYAFSPYGKRISDYLALRGIDYALCVRTSPNLPCIPQHATHTKTQEQPFVLPRPDLALLPVNYRRIPLVAVGRDIYLDTRVILRKLESLPDMPSAPLGATNGPDRFTEKLIEKYIVEGPVFEIAAGLVPVEMAQDPAFNKDRQGLLNRNWSRQELEEGKGECLNYIRNLYAFYETTILEDGRDWILGNEGPKLADIEGEWCPMAMTWEDHAHIASLAPSQIFYVRHVSHYSRCTVGGLCCNCR
jgi:glutathione S-transferase